MPALRSAARSARRAAPCVRRRLARPRHWGKRRARASNRRAPPRALWRGRAGTSAAEMYPLPSLSNTLMASRSSSSESVSCAKASGSRFSLGGLGRALLRALSAASHLHLARHKVQKLGEVNGAVAVRVNLQAPRVRPGQELQPHLGNCRGHATPGAASAVPDAPLRQRLSGREPPRTRLVDHVLQLSLRRVLPQRAHNRAQLLRRHSAYHTPTRVNRGKRAAGGGAARGGQPAATALGTACDPHAARQPEQRPPGGC